MIKIITVLCIGNDELVYYTLCDLVRFEGANEETLDREIFSFFDELTSLQICFHCASLLFKF